MEKMAFRKTYRKKNVVRKRKTYKKRGQSAGVKALKMVYRLKDTAVGEYKEWESVLALKKIGDGQNSPTVGNSIFAFPLCTPQNGTTNFDRIGDSIKLQRLTLRGGIAWIDQQAPASGTVTANVRVILFRGKHCEDKLWPTTTVAPGGESEFLDQMGIHGAKKDDSKYNSKIIFDRVYCLDIARKNYIPVNWSFPLNWHQKFIGQGTDIVEGGLYMIVLSDTGGSAKVQFMANYCVTFTDS